MAENVRGTRGYAAEADDLFARYEAFSFETVHSAFLDELRLPQAVHAGGCRLSEPAARLARWSTGYREQGMRAPRTFLGWAGVVFMLTVLAVIVMIAASVAFVIVAAVAILGAVISLVLLLAKRDLR